MAKRKRVRGHDLMLFLNDKAVALATSCSIDLSADKDTSSNKDEGLWASNEIVGMSWTASTDSLLGTLGTEEVATDLSYDELLEAYLAAATVKVIIGKIDSTESLKGVPETGWAKPETGWGGDAVITKLTLSGPDDGSATMSINLDGTGKFAKIPVV